MLNVVKLLNLNVPVNNRVFFFRNKRLESVLLWLCAVEESGKDIIRNAAAAVGSLSDSKFEILFNPDVFQLHVKHAQPEVVKLWLCLELIGTSCHLL